METLEYRYEAASKALDTLKEALALVENPTYEAIFKSLRDSAIQRFEYSIDTLWKLLKLYLQEKLGVSIENVTPRTVLRASLDAQLLSENEYNILLECVADRNLTSHTYQEALAQELLERMPLHYQTMHDVLQSLKIDELK